MCGKASRGQTLLWTTTDLWTMTYIGGDFIFSFAQAGKNCGIISPHASVVIDAGAYWMGNGGFFRFDGFVKPIECEVSDYVFGNINTAQNNKVWALANPLFGEVTWFYPSASATDCDSYVTHNYLEGHFVFGSLVRTTGVTQQSGATPAIPVMIGSDGKVYDHETGNVRSSSAYLESGPIELGDGDNVVRIQRIVPDDKTLGDVNAYIYTSMSPDSAETLNGPYTLSAITSVRLTARQFRVKLVEATASAWRVGIPRLGGILGGRR